MLPSPDIRYQASSRQVLVRSLVRLVILAAVASLNVHGFGYAFPQFLILAAAFCVVVAAMRREAVLGPVLTHVDEAAAYFLIGGLMSRVS